MYYKAKATVGYVPVVHKFGFVGRYEVRPLRADTGHHYGLDQVDTPVRLPQ